MERQHRCPPPPPPSPSPSPPPNAASRSPPSDEGDDVTETDDESVGRVPSRVFSSPPSEEAAAASVGFAADFDSVAAAVGFATAGAAFSTAGSATDCGEAAAGADDGVTDDLATVFEETADISLATAFFDFDFSIFRGVTSFSRELGKRGFVPVGGRASIRFALLPLPFPFPFPFPALPFPALSTNPVFGTTGGPSLDFGRGDLKIPRNVVGRDDELDSGVEAFSGGDGPRSPPPRSSELGACDVVIPTLLSSPRTMGISASRWWLRRPAGKIGLILLVGFYFNRMRL